MTAAPARSLLDYLSQVPEVRGRQGRRHALSAMLATVVCAVLAGARGYTAMTDWLHSLELECCHLLGFTRRPPKSGAFRKLLNKLSASALEEAIRRWVNDQLGRDVNEAELQPVAIDGKSLCGTLQPFQRMVHLLSLFDQQTGGVLSQLRVDDKTNEAKASLELLSTILLKGRVITADAMFCQRDVCEAILKGGGHYLIVVKDNQPTLQENIAAEFKAAFSPCNRATAAGAY